MVPQQDPSREPARPDPLLAALRANEEGLQMALAAGQVGLWDWDMVGGKVTWSDEVYRMHEMDRSIDPGGLEGFRSRLHPDDLPMIDARLAAALAGGPAYSAEFRTVLPDGRIRWLTTTGHLVRDAQGKPVRMVGASTDITERMELLEAERRARAQAEAARRRLDLLARAGAEHARSLDPQDTLLAIAKTLVPSIADWCRIDVMGEDGVLRRAIAYHVDPRKSEEALAMARRMAAARDTAGAMASVLARGEPYYGHYDSPETLADPALHEYTHHFGMRAHFVLPLIARGRVVGVMAVIQAESGRDLSEDDRALTEEFALRAALALDNARLYAEAESARRQAERASQAKDEFLAMLGHELRNPLAPISTALELMARREPTAAVEERRIISRQVRHMSRLIDDLLDISRITRGKVELRREPVDIRAVIHNAVEQTLPVFDKHAHPVELRLAAQPAHVAGDPVRLAQVVGNLLVNAAKFTPRDGRVVLTQAVRDGWTELVVEDTGCGIDAGLLPHVFEMFVQGHQPMDRQSGGLGLGLALVRTLVEMHGGTVSAASDGPGRGSRFTVRLPCSEHVAPAAQAPAPIAVKDEGTGRILVVDDNTDAAETLGELLRIVGYEVRCAGHARTALAALDSFTPHLALLDIGLPDIDGYELAGMLRRDARAAQMKLVALTGYGSESDRARALEASFDEHLVKPVSPDRLFDVLRQLVPPASA